MPLLPSGEQQPSSDSRATVAPQATGIGQVAEGAATPPRSAVAGVPGRVQRQTTDQEVAQVSRRARQLGQQASALVRSA